MKKTAPSWYAMIWIAGDYKQAVQACRQFTLGVGLCVTVTPTTYVYTGGAEEGVSVRLIAYPRFPDSTANRTTKAERLAEHLKAALCQGSYSIEYQDETVWVSTREQDTGSVQTVDGRNIG